MKILLEFSKVLSTILLFILIFNWTELNHIPDVRLALMVLLGVIFAMVQYVSYMSYKENIFD
jgi:hypothetical protein